MIREYTVNPPMPRIMVQPEELPILTNGFFSFTDLARARKETKRMLEPDVKKEKKETDVGLRNR